MDYTVRYGDSLWSISGRYLGDPTRWPEIARLNHLANPNHLLIGQRLRLPPSAVSEGGYKPAFLPVALAAYQPAGQQPATRVPARAFFFVLADEVDPFRKKLVRKVAFPKGLEDAALLDRVLHPERYGFHPRNPVSKIPVGRHVLGMTDSNLLSASERPFGSPRFEGKRYWIDVNKAQASGAIIHDGRAIGADLDRIAAKTKDPAFRSRIEDIRRKALVVDREVVIENHVVPGAVKGAGSMAVTRGLQVVEGVGIAMSVYDLSRAASQSYHEKSVIPIARESVRQVGGWAGAWAGAEIGGSAGALVGIETGPGAIITGAVGAFIGGVAGFLGADWTASRIGAQSQ